MADKVEKKEVANTPTAEECKELILKMNEEQCKQFCLLVHSNLELYNIVNGGVKNV